MAAASFVFTAFISAFLLFQVQPLMGKALLPWFGGTPLVWTTCMMFFQAVLLLGYAYAHIVITKLRPVMQWLLHLLVMGVGLLFAALFPDAGFAPTGEEQPALHLLRILALHVGPPFFALSATAPLVQAWFRGRFSERSPYPLYAVSNAGSLVGVLSYPFVIEPLLPLSAQGVVWRAGYVAYAVGLGVSGFLFWRRAGAPVSLYRATASLPDNPDVSDERAVEDDENPSLWKWLLFSASGSVLLLATTDQISQDVAASPLFWVIPLCLYLLSFILCFAEERLYRRAVWLSLLPVAAVAVGAQLFLGGGWPVPLQLVVYALTLFVGCMVAHGELARLKPAVEGLSRYYLAVSLGGVLGGVFVAVLAPLLFPDMWEFALGWLALYTLVMRERYREAGFEFFKGKTRLFWVVFVVGWLAVALIFVADVIFDHRAAYVTSRTFFGRVAVFKNRQKRCLYHGRIRHGCQWNDPSRAMDATTYYGADSGINIAHRLYSELNPAGGLNIGVVGLGVGTAAIFGAHGDRIRFFELDSEVLRFAETHFSYLRNARAETDVVVGDGRLSLEKEQRTGAPRYDILVLDAFAGDAVPLHLLTREAFALYWRRIAPKGLLVANISNRHVHLEPLMLGLADACGKRVVRVEGQDDWSNMLYSSTWIIMSDNDVFMDKIEENRFNAPWPKERAGQILFTDQYSNLVSLF